MPMLYGEEERAFFRLQAEIISSCPDTTIFAWMLRRDSSEDILNNPMNSYSGVIASSPAAFRRCAEVTSLSGESTSDFSMSNRGIKLRAQFGLIPLRATKNSCLVLPVCRIQEGVYGIRMRSIGRFSFVRQNAYELVRIYPQELAQQLMFEPYLLTQISPQSMTAEQTQSLILGSRQCVLEVVLPPDMEVYRRWPWQQWDEQDAVFFGPRRPPEDIGWASLKVVAWIPSRFRDPDAPSSVDFLFYAFDWASDPGKGSPPRSTIHRVRGGADDRALEQMNHEAVRDCWNAIRVANRLVVNKVSEQNFLVAGTSGKDALLLIYGFSCVEDGNKCLNPFWRAEFSWRVVPKDQVPKASNQNWTGIKWGTMWNPQWEVGKN